MMVQPLLQCKNISLQNGSILLLEKVNIQIPYNAIVGLKGKSGSGKSSLALAFTGLQPKPMSILEGDLFFQGKNLLNLSLQEKKEIRGAKISYVFQDPFSSLHPSIAIGKQIMETPIAHGMKKKEARYWMHHLLDLINLPKREKMFPHQLSGGERQRVGIAIALSGKPALLIADEPTTALDAITQKEILDLFISLKQKLCFSILFISHDQAVIEYVSDYFYETKNNTAMQRYV